MALTTTFWRNAWKYQARAYRHAFWDSGTILANLLAVAAANGVPTNVVLGFADAQVNAVLDAAPTWRMIGTLQTNKVKAAPSAGQAMPVRGALSLT